MLNFQESAAIVTGGASGIGLAITQALVAKGTNVVISSRRKALLQEVAQRLNAEGKGKVSYSVCDVREKAQVQAMVNQCTEEFGRIDVLVNNAGLGVQDLVIDCPEDNWDLVLDTCTKGTFLASQAVLPSMQQQGSGFIINIASQAAKNGYANAAPYCAAKFGVLGFGLALQEEVRQFGIKVHSLCPGLVQVPAPGPGGTEKPGWLQTQDLAEAVIYLLNQPKRVHIENIGMWGVQ